MLASSFAMAPTTPVMRTVAPSMGVAPDLTEKPWTSGEISDAAGLEALADKLNPIVGYWDPLNIGDESAETIAWFRHAEIKHGRVAMAAFVGYIVQANGICFPWDLQNAALGLGDGSTISFADISAAGSPPAQWDALPSAAKLQIIAGIGFLEFWGESSAALEKAGAKHYVRGGKPGFYPPFNSAEGTIAAPHPVPLNLWDPFGLTKKMTDERKAKALLAEVNNGRLAMIGIMGVLAASKGLIVPGLDSLPIPPYDGEIMAPFATNNVDLPFVEKMLSIKPSLVNGLIKMN